ncbi:hypothetical protein ACGF0D_39430 [Kitasatospora sp. NPDC048298]|uniref:hypothetical protein n=1 Tax=Kitasatospora sp. NPDC048298 TaxID=3364049 RepID=UPI00372010DF
MRNLEHSQQRLAQLDVSIEVFHASLEQAIADVRGCTDFDAPMMRGIMFWSRTNRYMAEGLDPQGWKRTSRDNIADDPPDGESRDHGDQRLWGCGEPT